jgi:hypothetical protein
LCYVLCFEFCVICCSYSLIVLLFTFFNSSLFIFFLMFAFNMLYTLFFLFLQVVDASFSLSIVEHSIMELNLQIYLNQYHCETKKCSLCYYYKPKCMKVDNDLNMTFCNLVEGSIYVWDVLVKYDTRCATISTHVSKHQFQNLTNCNITLSISNACVASLLHAF